MKKLLLTVIAALVSFNAYALPITATTGSDFTINYDSIGGDPATSVDGLSASVNFYDFTFTLDDTDLNNVFTTVGFSFDVTNTSTAPILTSRVSTLGFSTNPDVIVDDSSVSGIFDTVSGPGNVPNQGTVEFCFSDVNCAGGGSAGVEINSSALGASLLIYAGDIASVDFDQFSIRYQSVSCSDTYTGNCPGSASGNGDVPSGDVPSPAILGIMAIGLLGVGASTGLRRRKISS